MEEKTSNFVHLHVHSNRSLLDGLGTIKGIVSKVKANGMKAVALTDHGVAYGLVEFYDECVKQGIKPILGCEFYEAPESRFEKTVGAYDENRYYHLILLVKNEQGYKNLCKLITRSNTEGFYYKPRIDFELLKEFHEGLICLSACVAGRVPRSILKGAFEDTEAIIAKYRELFGEDYYLEIQNHGIKEEAIVAQELIRLSQKLNIKLVCTNDCHYVNSEDKEAHEWLICMQTQSKLDEPHMQYIGDYSVKTEEEMRALFPNITDAFDNTWEVAQKCNFEFHYAHGPADYRMPKVVIPENYGNDYYRYLEDEAWKGFEERYPVGHPEREQAHKNVEYELSVIKNMGFAEYFLDTRKTIFWSRSHGILVGPGRGSAAGSTMCYCLKITDIDPVKYDLIFERFLNPERISMPDIDVDYDYARKEDVIASEAESNGWSNFSKIMTIGTMKAKAVLRDCARVAGYPYAVGEKLSNFIPRDPGATLMSAYEQNKEMQDFIHSDPGYEKLWEIALKLENCGKSVGTHACGHIPTPVPCEELYPCSVDGETGYLICQYNMTEAEHLGNLKKDILLLRNLSIITYAHKEVKNRLGIEVPLWNEEVLNDKEALALIACGDTNGIFQIESPGMTSFMKRLKPDCFEDIIAGIALYRPGPMDFIPAYINGKHDPSSITYETPELESILKPTYGQIVYQEQVMLIVQKLAGFSMGRADVVRKAMGKKKMDVMAGERINFVSGNPELGIKGCVNNGISEEIANHIYDQMIDFAKYAFNKSHAACYAAVTMQTAYLKAHYPLEFMTGLLTSVMGDTDKLAMYIKETKAKGIQVLPPDINVSKADFAISEDGKNINHGLCSIKRVGREVIDEVVHERETNGKFIGLTDFVKRNPGMNKGVLESLIKSGAFSNVSKYNRRTLMMNMETVLDVNKKMNKDTISGQVNLLDMFAQMEEDTSVYEDSFKELPEYSKKDIAKMEKELTGLYLTASPLGDYENYIKKHVNIFGKDMKVEEEEAEENLNLEEDEELEIKTPDFYDRMKVTAVGTILEAKNIFTKKGDQMAFLTLEDDTGEMEVVVFPKTFQACRGYLDADQVVSISGQLSITTDKRSIIADTIVSLEDVPKNLWIRVPNRAAYEEKNDVVEGLKEVEGQDNVILYFEQTREKVMAVRYTHISEMTVDMLKEVFGEEEVKLTY